MDKTLDVEANPEPGSYNVGAVQGGLDGLKQRQKLWINKRHFVKGQTAKWRPEKRHRVSAKRFLRQLDSQFQISTHTGGLVFFQYDEKDPKWHPSNWQRWPYLGIAIDHGPDGLAGYNALDHKFKCNVDLWGDTSHGGNRDVFKGLGDCGLKQWWQCMAISFNCPFGPNSDNGWKTLLDATLSHVKTRYRPLSLPLFMESSPKMLQQLMAAGIEFDECSELSLEQQLFEFALTQGFERRSGGKITNSRFQSGIHGALKKLPYWALDKFLRTLFVFLLLFVPDCCLCCGLSGC